MNWLVFGITAYMFLAAQIGLHPLIVFNDVTPNLLLILAVFVGLSASSRVTLAALMLLGLLLDLQPGPLSRGGVIVGPNALGYLVGGYAILQLRNLVFRDSVATIVLMVFAVGGFAALVEVMLYSFRGLPWPANEAISWSAMEQLSHRFYALLYTAIVAIPMGLILQRTRKLWGFADRPRGGPRIYG